MAITNVSCSVEYTSRESLVSSLFFPPDRNWNVTTGSNTASTVIRKRSTGNVKAELAELTRELNRRKQHFERTARYRPPPPLSIIGYASSTPVTDFPSGVASPGSSAQLDSRSAQEIDDAEHQHRNPQPKDGPSVPMGARRLSRPWPCVPPRGWVPAGPTGPRSVHPTAPAMSDEASSGNTRGDQLPLARGGIGGEGQRALKIPTRRSWFPSAVIRSIAG